MKSNTNVLYLVSLLGSTLLGFILWNINYDEEELLGSECVGPSPMLIDSVLSTRLPALSEKGKDGELLFKANCAACHKVVKPMTGPALLPAVEGYPSDTLLLAYIKSVKPSEGTRCFSFVNFELEEASALLTYIKAFE